MMAEWDARTREKENEYKNTGTRTRTDTAGQSGGTGCTNSTKALSGGLGA